MVNTSLASAPSPGTMIASSPFGERLDGVWNAFEMELVEPRKAKNIAPPMIAMVTRTITGPSAHPTADALAAGRATSARPDRSRLMVGATGAGGGFGAASEAMIWARPHDGQMTWPLSSGSGNDAPQPLHTRFSTMPAPVLGVPPRFA